MRYHNAVAAASVDNESPRCVQEMASGRLLQRSASATQAAYMSTKQYVGPSASTAYKYGRSVWDPAYQYAASGSAYVQDAMSKELSKERYKSLHNVNRVAAQQWQNAAKQARAASNHPHVRSCWSSLPSLGLAAQARVHFHTQEAVCQSHECTLILSVHSGARMYVAQAQPLLFRALAMLLQPMQAAVVIIRLGSWTASRAHQHSARSAYRSVS